ISLLWNITAEPILCFDGDAAGQRAAYRAADKALPMLQPGKSLRFAMLTGGKDPDDFVKEFGKAGFEHLTSESKTLVDVIWERALSSGPLDTPERRAVVVRELRELTKQIADPIVRRFYDNEFFERTGREFFGRNKRHFDKRPVSTPAAAAEAFKLTEAYFQEKKKMMIDTLVANVSMAILLHHQFISEELLEMSLMMQAYKDEINSFRDEIVYYVLNTSPDLRSSTLQTYYNRFANHFTSTYSRFEGYGRALVPAFARPGSDARL